VNNFVAIYRARKIPKKRGETLVAPSEAESSLPISLGHETLPLEAHYRIGRGPLEPKEMSVGGTIVMNTAYPFQVCKNEQLSGEHAPQMLLKR
jgi:hypothetical protein